MSHLPLNNLHGFFLLNKPLGISSNDAMQMTKHYLGAKKAGHAGSLDPLASGLLLILFGQATKFSNLLLNQSKIYEVTAKLGITTTTGDIEGDVIEEKSVPELTLPQVIETLQTFEGSSKQRPPIYSALKYQGRPLYEFARKNLSVPIKERSIQVDYLELLSLEKNHLKLRLRCSKGTYVRTLVEDIGRALGCGAHCFQLKRTAIGDYPLSQAHSLFELQQKKQPSSFILSLNQLIPDTQKTWVSNAAAYYLFKGQPIVYPWSLSSTEETLYLHLKHTGEFLGTGKTLPDGRIAPVRLIDPSILT